MQITPGLRKALREGRLILFVGAGVSANLGLPSWGELIGRVGAELGYPPERFSTLGEWPALAEFYRIQRGDFSELAHWMDETWHRSPGPERLAASRIHELIPQLEISLIYTTNYDRWLEKAFVLHGKPFVKVVTVKDMLAENQGEAQIVKYHGDFDEPSTLVLSETEFFERLEFESPLDIKLRSDTLANSVLFIGYSLSDINLRLLFYRLSRLWNRFGPEESRPASFFFTHRENPVQEAVLRQWGITTISRPEEDAGKALRTFLEELACSP